MNYSLIFERVYMRPLCVHTDKFLSVHAFLLPRLAGKVPLEITIAETRRTGAANDQPAPPTHSPYSGKRRQKAGPSYDRNDKFDPRFYTEAAPGVAVVPIYGALAKNLSAWEESCGGGTDINAPQEALRQAANAPDIRAIILDIDSPGGEVTNIPEFGKMVAASSAVKPVYAFSDAMIASAAYWLASQANELYVTPSSSIGSIGTYLAWLDETVKMQLEGLKLEFFGAGKYKGMGLPGKPLSTDDRMYLQNRVDKINDQFKATVLSTRPNVNEDTMQGQTFTGEDAVANGLVDGTVNSFDDLLELV